MRTDTSRLPLPEPAAGMAAYNAEREACIKLDERKQRNYQSYLAHRTRRSNGVRAGEASIHYLPVKLDIENSSRCNFACGHCAVSTWPKGKRADDMTLEQFKRLIDDQYGLVEIKLNGLGEALMQGDDYFEMIRYARERRIWVRMTTNASLLHLRDNGKKLIDSGVNDIDISMDGADKQTFEGIRIQSDFYQVAENCRALNGYAKFVGKPSAKMWTLVQRKNVHDLEEHVRCAGRWKFQHLVFSVQMHGWANSALEERNRAEAVSIEPARAAALVELGRECGVRVAFWDVSTKFDSKNLCPWPFERAVVTSDLRTVPCCMIGDPDQFEIGKGKTFLQNWVGVEYADFRRAHLEGNIPQVCKGCYKAAA